MVENGKKSYIKMRSIARKISVEWNFKIIFDFLIIDIIFAFAKIFYWRVSQEAMYFERNILEKENILLKGEFVYQKGVSISEFIENLYYDIPGSDYFIYAGDAFTETIFLFGVLLVTEILMIIIGFFKGGKKVRRKLEPLDKLAATAQMISTASFDFEKIHDLEDALDKIDTDRDDESELKVSTGNTELQGIENAINNLISRMRSSYIQQARFVSDASHELRTPISVIQGYTNMLLRWGKNDEKILDESITAIKTESESMSRLIEQLLFLARGDNGKNHLKIETINLSHMIKEIYDEYTMVDQTHNYILNDSKEDVIACGDSAMIKQTARILVDNAVKYTPAGNDIIVSAFMEQGNIPAFEVQDYGIGISGEDISKVFERFYRADDARNRKTGGTGLGLSIAKWIVDRHKGYFKVSSYVGVGTKFTVCFPENLINEKDAENQNE